MQLRRCGGQADSGHAAWQAQQRSVRRLLHLCHQGSPGTLRASQQMQKVCVFWWLSEVCAPGVGNAGALMNATLCSSFSRACIASRDPYCGWVKESGACMQLVLGSKWVRALPGWPVKLWRWHRPVLSRAIWNMGHLGKEKCGKFLFLPYLHSPLKCLTNFFDVNSQLIGNCGKRRKKKMKELY